MNLDYNRLAQTILDEEWQRELIERFTEGLPHRRHLRRLVNNIVRDPALTEDILQEVHTAGWLHVTAGGKIEDTKAWLSRAARNRAVDVFRKRRKEISTESLPEGADEAQPYRKVIEEMLAPLSAAQKDRVVFYFSGFPDDQMTLDTLRYVIARVTEGEPIAECDED